MSARVSTILARNAGELITVTPDATLAETAQVLTAHNIGAVVVSADGTTVDGVLSERDIVRRLVSNGAGALHLRAGEVMTTEVITCARSDTADQLMATMTERRIRHLPVVEDGALVGVISMRDVVRCRIDELEVETASLHSYVTGAHS